MPVYLIYLSISPVQSFISQARKSSDLFAGSRILSELVRGAVEKFNLTDKLIIPAPGYDSFPNRFIAEVELDDADSENFGGSLASQVKKSFKNIAKTALKGVSHNGDFEQKYMAQTDDALNVTWLLFRTAASDDELNYKLLESNFAAVKNQRPFSQHAETGRKCSVCGERNALVINESESISGEKIKLRKGGKNYDPDAVNIFGNQRFMARVQDGEGLCAVCFTKRIYGGEVKEEAFMSTAEVALAKVLNGLRNKPEIASLLSEYENLDGFDHQLYYEENLTSKYFNKHGLQNEGSDKYLSQLKKKSAIKSECQQTGLRLNLPKYYAVILFDGDNMGKVLSGEYLKDKTVIRDFRYKLSGLLGEYSKRAKSFVNNSNGKVVYAGGEDFLALINMEDSLPVLSELRNMFNEIVHSGVSEFLQPGRKLSFSAGVCISHYKTPLSFVLAKARETEKKAKNHEGKDAFSVSVLKHSGEILECVMPFSYENETGYPVLIKNISDSLYNDSFSNTFIKNLHDEFIPLLSKEGELQAWDTMFNEEMERLVTRACMVKGKAEKKAAIRELTHQLKSLKKPCRTKIRNFLNSLAIIDFMQRRRDGGE